MAHQTNIPYLNNSNILQYLDLFARTLLQQHGNNLQQFRVLVVGGAALSLKYSFSGTVDIDADISFGGNISKSIQYVSKVCNIPSDWLNQDFVKSHSYSRRLWEDAVPLTVLQNYLNVYLVSDISQVCMKLTAGRQKDMQDLMVLCKALKQRGCTYNMVLQHFQYLYAGYENPKPKALKVVKASFK